MMRALRLLLLALPLLPPGVSAQAGPDERVFIEEAKRDVLEKIEAAVAARQWKQVFERAAQALALQGNALVPAGPDRWVSLREHLLVRLGRLPPEGVAAYRAEYDGPARAAFDKARESGDRAALERAAEDWFLSTPAEEVVDALAARAFDEGRAGEAATLWRRLLRHYPGARLSRTTTAARLAQALRALGGPGASEELKALSEFAGRVRVGGEESDLASLLTPLPPKASEVPPRPAAPALPISPPEATARGVRAEVRRWRWEPAADKPVPARARGPGLNLVAGGGVRSFRSPDFVQFAASGAWEGKDYVAFGDGAQVIVAEPRRLRRDAPEAGIYWRHPAEGPVSRELPASVPQRQPFQMPDPWTGPCIDGDRVFVPMLSTLEARPRETGPPGFEAFQGPTSLKAFDLATGKLLWDTDRAELAAALRQAGARFLERNFAYCGTPLSRGGRVYVPVCTSPQGDQESYVACFDRGTGRPVWVAFLASALGQANLWNGGRGLNLAQTTIEERDGTLYALTNLGAVAALQGSTGTLKWLARYRRTGRRTMHGMGQEYGFHRGPVAPIVRDGRVLVLPQDRAELLAFDAAGGRPVELPAVQCSGDEFEWKNVGSLLGPVDDSLVLAGSPSFLLRLKNFSAYRLYPPNTRGFGRGTIAGGFLYLSTSGGESNSVEGELCVWDTRTWMMVGSSPWREPEEGGNLHVTGNLLLVTGRGAAVYSSLAEVQRLYAARLGASPPHAATLLEYGDLMHQNGRLAEAAQAYQGFLAAAEGDPAFGGRMLQVRSDLHGIFLRRGEDALLVGRTAEALEAYGFASAFAWEPKGETDALRGRAAALERMERFGEAVAAYQEILERRVPLFAREDDRLVRASEQAAARIRALAGADPKHYASIETRAGEALSRAGRDEAELRSVMLRFPHSQAARASFETLRRLVAERGDAAGHAALLGAFGELFGADPDRALLMEWAEAAARAGDGFAEAHALDTLARRFGSEKVGEAGAEEPVEAWVRRRRSRERPARPGPPKATGRFTLLEESDAGDPGRFPLSVSGAVPPSLDPAVDVFWNGSRIELRRAGRPDPLWSAGRSAAGLGVRVQAVPEGLRVAALLPGSPAEKAGLAEGDVLSGVGGKPLRGAVSLELLEGREPGERVTLTVVTGGVERTVEATLEALSPKDGPPPVGAAYTAGGRLAVAWPDVAAVLDLSDGRRIWSFRPARAGLQIRWIAAVDDVVYVHEAMASREGRPAEWKPEAANLRLYAFSAGTGVLRWARAFDFDPLQPDLDVSVTFLGRSPSDAGVFLHKRARPGGGPEWNLLRATGEEGLVRKPLKGNVLATAWEPERSVFYAVADPSGDPSARTLYAFDFGGGKDAERPIGGEAYLPQRFGACSLVASRDTVAVVAPPPQAGGEARVLVAAVPGLGLRPLALPGNRTLPQNWTQGAAAGRDGTLYLYMVPRDNPLLGCPALLAFRPERKDALAWEAPAPTPAGIFADPPRILTDAGGYVAVAISSGRLEPGEVTAEGVATVYDPSREGYLVLSRKAIQLRAGTSRERLYLLDARGRLSAWGE
jgi:outer membrane protein assembly factor BamB